MTAFPHARAGIVAPWFHAVACKGNSKGNSNDTATATDRRGERGA